MGTIAAVETMEWRAYVTGKHVAEGFCMPWGWGISRYCMLSDRRQIHPIPLNYIISFGWWLYYKLGKPWFVEAAFEEQVKYAKYKSRWWGDGWKAGWEDCVRTKGWETWERLYLQQRYGVEPLTDNLQEDRLNERLQDMIMRVPEAAARETIRRLVNE